MKYFILFFIFLLLLSGSFLMGYYTAKFLEESKILKDDNYKDLLLRYAQFIKTEHPEYNTIKENGQPHNRQFVVEVRLFGERQGKGINRIKKEAEQQAAKEAIKRLNITPNFAGN